MELGDFTKLAKDYVNRTGYSETALRVLKSYIEAQNGAIEAVADVGAGTGKLTQDLENLGLRGYAVEPNDAMRAEGVKLFDGKDSFVWSKGLAEATGLPDNSVDWVLMGSSFHWADAPVALEEFHRILRPRGFFTAIWNPRNLEGSPFHMDIEKSIQEMVPHLKRVSSGSRANMQDMEGKLLSTPFFEDLFLIEAPHQAVMSKGRYMGAWRSVNDIHAQAGDGLFEQILKMIEEKIRNQENITVPYLSRAFTVRSTKC
ncbi:MAG: class I SAM-dependent methyltransferase [Oscillospiraceae bacterium]|nr:class I SAM-dependent methyltransferase [Oscillospiraceae bacterium]